jgi:hypothetical protein
VNELELIEATDWQTFRRDPRAIEVICNVMGERGTLNGIARKLGVSFFALWSWIHENEERASLYARARDAQAEAMKEAIQELEHEPVRRNFRGDLDPADVALKRLKADNLKWLAAKVAPKRYGDKLEVDAHIQHDVVGELRAALQSRSRLPLRSEAGD